MSCDIHVGDVGTVLNAYILDCSNNAIDISSATTKTITLKKPDGTSLSKTADFITDGSDGGITYTTISGDLSIAGTWKIQAIVTTGSGTWYSDIQSFKVNRNL